MAADIRIDVDADDFIRKLRDDGFIREPLRVALTKVGRHAETEAKQRAPVAYGRLRASITHAIVDEQDMISVDVGIVGITQDLRYAWGMEYGTGTQTDHPTWPRKPHAVSPGALLNWRPIRRAPEDARWALAVSAARAITLRGGLKPRRFLRGALEDGTAKYVGFMKQAIARLRIDG